MFNPSIAHGDNAGNDLSRFGITATERVTHRRPCPVCGHDSQCLIFPNGDVLCNRQGEPAHWTDAFMGGYWHRAYLGEFHTSGADAPRTPAPSSQPIPAIDVDTRDAIYRDLLALCPLPAALAEQQHLTTEQAARYGWLPHDAAARRGVAEALLKTYTREQLLAVAGFIERNHHVEIAGAGIILPTRDLTGRIVALDVRRDHVEKGQSRYYKLSSRDATHPDAPSPGTPVHVAVPAGGVWNPQQVWITEGVKKADALADATRCRALSIPGVGCWAEALPALEALAGDIATIALDRDHPTINPRGAAAVERARRKLAAACVEFGYAVRVATWPYKRGKGIDDVLSTPGETYTLERYRPSSGAEEKGEASEQAAIEGIAPADDGSGMVCVDPELLALLIKRSAQTETLRRRYHMQNALISDKRIKPSEKVVTAAVWDMIPGVGASDSPAPRKIYRAAVAERTGLGVSTISRKLDDLHAMGLINLERRQTALDNTELWVGVGKLPDKALTANEVNALAAQRQKDRERKRRCPRCGSEHLKAIAYTCLDCGHDCSEDEAIHAGETMVVTDAGAVVDTDTGEIVTPAPPRAESAALFSQEPRCADSVPRPSKTAAGMPPLEPMDLDEEHARREREREREQQAAAGKPTQCRTCLGRQFWQSERWPDQWYCTRCEPKPARVAAGAR